MWRAARAADSCRAGCASASPRPLQRRPDPQEASPMTVTPYAGSPYTYFDTPTAAPFGIVELMPGVRNLLEYAQLQPGEKVLILTEHTVDPVVLQAIAAGVA